ncbi:MAG: hypothetical protein WKH64_04775 [Chloroflexia bacterium]
MKIWYMLLVVVASLFGTTAATAQETSVKVSLMEQNSSNVAGAAVLTANADGTTTVLVQLSGPGAGEGVHPIHLHEGTCKGTIPTIRYPLENVVKGKSETKVNAPLSQLLSETLYINIHPSKEMLFPVTTCGDLSAPTSVPKTGAGALTDSSEILAALALAVVGVSLSMGALLLIRRAM